MKRTSPHCPFPWPLKVMAHGQWPQTYVAVRAQRGPGEWAEMLGLYQMLPTPHLPLSLPKEGPPRLSLFPLFPLISISHDLEIQTQGTGLEGPKPLCLEPVGLGYGKCESGTPAILPSLCAALSQPQNKGVRVPQSSEIGQGHRWGTGCCSPGSLAHTPPRLSPTALGWRGGGSHTLSCRSQLCTWTRLAAAPGLSGSQGGELAAHKPGPGSEMGRETRMGRRGSSPQGGTVEQQRQK